MHSVKVKVKDLLLKVKENKEKHKLEYESALDFYREAAIEKVANLLDKLKKENNEQEFLKTNLSISLVKPVQFLSEYDRAIAMLEATTDKIVELDQHQFDSLWLDNWAWKDTFQTSTMSYNNSR